MDTKIKRWGNSQGVIIPKTILAKMKIDEPEGQPVNLEVEGNRLVITKQTGESKISRLFDGFDLDAYYQENGAPSELLGGTAVGKELL